jgi:hypothetical protein
MEKKVTFLQNILMEMKLQERAAPQVEMVNPMDGVVFQNPVEVSKEEVEELPEEEYYNSVAAAVPAALEEAEEAEDVSVPVVPTNYESFSKQELLAAVKQRSLKVSKNAKITELVALLRKDDELKAPALAAVEPSSAEGSLGAVLELNA